MSDSAQPLFPEEPPPHQPQPPESHPQESHPQESHPQESHPQESPPGASATPGRSAASARAGRAGARRGGSPPATRSALPAWLAAGVGLAIFAFGMLATTYRQFVIDVPAGHMAILLRKTGTDLPNTAEIALDPGHKGIQAEVLREGRYFFQYNPLDWSWEVLPQVVVPNGKMGVRVRLAGDDLPTGELLA